MTNLKETHISGLILLKIRHKICVGYKFTMSFEFTVSQNFLCEGRTLTGKEGNFESWNGNIWLDSEKTEHLELLYYSEPTGQCK